MQFFLMIWFTIIEVKFLDSRFESQGYMSFLGTKIVKTQKKYSIIIMAIMYSVQFLGK